MVEFAAFRKLTTVCKRAKNPGNLLSFSIFRKFPSPWQSRSRALRAGTGNLRGKDSSHGVLRVRCRCLGVPGWLDHLIVSPGSETTRRAKSITPDMSSPDMKNAGLSRGATRAACRARATSLSRAAVFAIRAETSPTASRNSAPPHPRLARETPQGQARTGGAEEFKGEGGIGG